ncbi:MAG: hypothetical protein EPO52_05710 [Herbiconiux sp.]|uniref:hypothetical protein n=1 Tax=Herbiconiux sp. TaxID=1871186 RepID=UPI00122536D4|nr:hypothetical protein [Herbiconiux sp.]TAJ48866.1 MAG: hypothetical protein EPO52_05710 [Herbiconiux sp.]
MMSVPTPAATSAASESITWVAQLEAWATLGAAVVTAVTGILIYLQIRQTQRSVKATELTLDLARSEQEVTRNTLVDNAKARIDAEMPRLTVEVTHQAKDSLDPLLRGQRDEDTLADLSVIQPGTKFILPQDAAREIGVRIGIVVSNDGPRRALIKLGSDHGDRKLHEHMLDVGKSKHFYLERIHTLAAWIEYAKLHLGDPSEHETSSCVITTITYVFPGDTGAIERHEVIQGGAMLVKTPGNDAGWEIAEFTSGPWGYPSMNAVAMPFTRDYYASFIDERRL